MLAATASARYAAGSSDQATVLRVQLEQTRIGQRLADLATERIAVQAAINRLTNDPPDTAIGRVTDLPPAVLPEAAGGARRTSVPASARGHGPAIRTRSRGPAGGCGARRAEAGVERGRRRLLAGRPGSHGEHLGRRGVATLEEAKAVSARRVGRERAPGGPVRAGQRRPSRPGPRRPVSSRNTRTPSTRSSDTRVACSRRTAPRWMRPAPATSGAAATSSRCSTNSGGGWICERSWPDARPIGTPLRRACQRCWANLQPSRGSNQVVFRSHSMTIPSLSRHRRPRPFWLVFGGAVVLLVAVVFLAGCAAQAAPQLYHCPMHPEYVSDKPGTAPSAACGWCRSSPTLPSRRPAWRRTNTSTAPRRRTRTSTPARCTPKCESDKPGSCPKCGMDLVKKAPAAAPGKKATEAGAPRVDAPTLAGLAPVHTEDGRAEMAGIRTAVATDDAVVTAVRAVGTVVPDETRIRHVTTKVGGWVEKLLRERRRPDRARPDSRCSSCTRRSCWPARRSTSARARPPRSSRRPRCPRCDAAAKTWPSSARRRLELFDVPLEFLEQLDRTGKAQRTVVFRAPFSGLRHREDRARGAQDRARAWTC